jgi:hypothetical protein
MASTFSPNLNLELVGRGDQIGVWDTPENSDWSILDSAVGAIATISLNNANVVLSNAQFRSKTITFNSTLTGSVTIFFPSSFTKSYEIQNLCTGSSAFTVTLTAPTSQSGTFISCPPGEIIDVVNDGINIKFKNLGRVGTLWDYGGSSVPNWVSQCGTNNIGLAPLPYLNCDGTAFSSAIYPALTVTLGGTTLPDIRGTQRYALNQGTGRLTTASGGLDGNTNLSLKTTQVTIGTSNLPAYTPAGTIANGAITMAPTSVLANVGGNLCPGGGSIGAGQANTASQAVSTFTGTAQGGVSNVLPVGTATVVGITMIRAG